MSACGASLSLLLRSGSWSEGPVIGSRLTTFVLGAATAATAGAVFILMSASFLIRRVSVHLTRRRGAVFSPHPAAHERRPLCNNQGHDRTLRHGRGRGEASKESTHRVDHNLDNLQSGSYPVVYRCCVERL